MQINVDSDISRGKPIVMPNDGQKILTIRPEAKVLSISYLLNLIFFCKDSSEPPIIEYLPAANEL
jgi:hypothetical protein